MNTAVERAANYIWEHYSEPLSLADIAGSAMLSRFHFSRLFRAATSVSPCRFLSAVRIYQAKYALLATSMSITDIAFAVGYNSVGSFTNHFTASVGVRPSLYRRIAHDGNFEFPCPEQNAPATGTVHGTIKMPGGCAGGRIYLGAFSTAVVQHQAAAAIIVDIPAHARPALYRLPAVPMGRWFIHAIGIADCAGPASPAGRPALVGGHSQVSVIPGSATWTTISLRSRQMTDPPVLLALPEIEVRTTGSARSGSMVTKPAALTAPGPCSPDAQAATHR